MKLLAVKMLLFSISLNLLGRGSKLLIVLLAITALEIMGNRRWRMSAKTGVLIMGLLVYSLSAFMNGFLSVTFLSTHIVCLFLFSYWGRELCVCSKYSEEELRKSIGLVFCGFVVMGTYSLIYSIINGIETRMEIPNMWGGNPNSGIQQTVFFVLPESLLFYYLFVEDKKAIKLVGIISGVLSVVNILYFSGRSGAGIIAIANCIALIVYWKNTNGLSRLKLLTIIVIGILAVYFMWNATDSRLVEIWKQSNMYDRLYVTKSGVESDSRLATWSIGIQEVLKAPWGSKFRYAHNFWIDLALEGGIITGLLFVVYSLMSIKDTIVFVKKAKCSYKTKVFVASVYTGVITAFMLEPMMQSLPLLVGSLVFMDAAINETNRMYMNNAYTLYELTI